jgi:hypothetical protein
MLLIEIIAGISNARRRTARFTAVAYGRFKARDYRRNAACMRCASLKSGQEAAAILATLTLRHGRAR